MQLAVVGHETPFSVMDESGSASEICQVDPTGGVEVVRVPTELLRKLCGTVRECVVGVASAEPESVSGEDEEGKTRYTVNATAAAAAPRTTYHPRRLRVDTREAIVDRHLTGSSSNG
jgi:hypothetical protein